MTDYEKGMIRPRQSRVFSGRMKWIAFALVIVNAFFIYSLWDKSSELVEIKERNDALAKSVLASQKEMASVKEFHKAVQQELEECKQKLHNKASDDEGHVQELNSCKSELDEMTKKHGQLEQDNNNMQEKVIPENEKLKQDVKALQAVIDEYKQKEGDIKNEEAKSGGDEKIEIQDIKAIEESLIDCSFTEENIATDKCKFSIDKDSVWSNSKSEIIENAQAKLENKLDRYLMIDSSNTPTEKTPQIMFQEVKGDNCLNVSLSLIIVNSGSLKLIDSGKDIASFPLAEKKSDWHKVVAFVPSSSAPHQIVLEGKINEANSALGLERILVSPIACPEENSKKEEREMDEPVDVDKARNDVAVVAAPDEDDSEADVDIAQ